MGGPAERTPQEGAAHRTGPGANQVPRRQGGHGFGRPRVGFRTGSGRLLDFLAQSGGRGGRHPRALGRSRNRRGGADDARGTVEPEQHGSKRLQSLTREGCRHGHSTRVDRLQDRKSTRLNSSHGYISYAVFCLKKKKKNKTINAYSLKEYITHTVQHLDVS